MGGSSEGEGSFRGGAMGMLWEGAEGVVPAGYGGVKPPAERGSWSRGLPRVPLGGAEPPTCILSEQWRASRAGWQGTTKWSRTGGVGVEG